MFRLALHAHALVASVAFAVLAIGCTPSPEATCNHLGELGRKDSAGFRLSMPRCIARMTEMKERDPDAYRCTAKTVAKLRTIDTALLAVSVCDHGGPSSRKRSDGE